MKPTAYPRDTSRAERIKNLVVAVGAVALFVAACIVVTLALAP